MDFFVKVDMTAKSGPEPYIILHHNDVPLGAKTFGLLPAAATRKGMVWHQDPNNYSPVINKTTWTTHGETEGKWSTNDGSSWVLILWKACDMVITRA